MEGLSVLIFFVFLVIVCMGLAVRRKKRRGKRSDRGYNRGSHRRRKRGRHVWIILLFLFLFILIIGILGSNSDSTDKTDAEQSETTQSETTQTETTQTETAQTESSAAEEDDTAQASEEEPEKAEEQDTSEPEESTSQEAADDTGEAGGSIEITMLDVGQGLAILINADGHYMLYDGGGRSYSSFVVSYLKSHDITELDYMFASHYDEDHIAGLVGVLNTTEVEYVVCPDYTTDTKIYQSFLDMKEKNGAETIHPSRGATYELGDCEIAILAPKSCGSSDNDNSIAVRLEYGDFSCIITGDAEEESEEQMIRSGYTLDSDIYVAGHHGSSSSSSTAFLNQVTPSYTFLSCGADNSYGHPTEQTLKRLKSVGSQIFRTDVQGTVTAFYDGEQLTFSTEPCEDWTPGNQKSESENDEAKEVSVTKVVTDDGAGGSSNATEMTYMLNTNTKKFHYMTCKSVSQMSEKNKKEVTATREEIISQGYEPCQNCTP